MSSQLTESVIYNYLNQFSGISYQEPKYNKKLDFVVDRFSLFIGNYLKEKINGELGYFTNYTYINSVIPYQTEKLNNKFYPCLKIFRIQDTFYHNEGVHNNLKFETDFQLQIEMINENEKVLYAILTNISRIIAKSLSNDSISKIIKLSEKSPIVFNYEKQENNNIVLISNFKVISTFGKLNNVFQKEKIDKAIDEFFDEFSNTYEDNLNNRIQFNNVRNQMGL